MAPIKSAIIASALAFAPYTSAQQQTPLMGYSSYNQVLCSPNEKIITDAINGMVDRGFLSSGYNYFTTDCGWASRDGKRNATTGSLAYDLQRFPRGLEPLSRLARSRGLKWTMYSDAGFRMCDTEVPSPVLGSLGSERADAELFKSLGAEYVKYDNCYADGPNANQNAPKDPRTDFVSRFTVMWNELKRVGINNMLICQWGTPFLRNGRLEGPAQWTRGISTSFRLSDDITNGWPSVYTIYNQVVHIARSGLTGPGNHMDADMLEVGNEGMTFDEQATHFASWALFKSPLMISTDVNALPTNIVNLLRNADLIAMNQDSLGKPVQLVQRWTGDRDVWMGPLANGDVAVLVVDLTNTRRDLTVPFSLLGISSANVKDALSGQTATNVNSFTRSVNGRGSLALRLSNVRRSNVAAPKINYVAASSGAVSNGANVQPCSGCASQNKVGNLGSGPNGRLVLSNLRTSQATQAVRFDYINGEVGYLFNGNNERLASISVNNGPAKTVSFPLSGYDWDKDVHKDYLVELSGFNTNGANTITISGVNSRFAPDFDRVGLVA